MIDSGQDLTRWEDGADRKKREQVLARLRTRLQAAPPAPKQVAKAIKSSDEWKRGEVIGFVFYGLAQNQTPVSSDFATLQKLSIEELQAKTEANKKTRILRAQL